MISDSDSIPPVNSKHQKTLAALFALPTPASVVFADIEVLLKRKPGDIKLKNSENCWNG